MSDLIRPYLRHLRAGGRSHNTIRLRAVVLRRLAESPHLPYGLDQAATHELAGFLAGYSGWTLYSYYQAIRDYYGWAAGGDDPWLTWDPTTDLIRPNHPDLLPDPVTDDELRTALAHSDDWWTDVILLAAKAGLRASEIAQLRREDITEHTIIVRRGKGGDPQSVPTDTELWQRLRDRGRGHVVVGRQQGRPMSGACLSTRARTHFDRAGLPRVHLHRFRHWYATTQLAAGADIRTVQENLRHRSVTSTQAYTLVTSAQRRAAVDALPTLGGAPAGS